MSWAKVDDQWWSHPKVMGLTLEARGLWITALSWSCAHRTDLVPSQFVTMVGTHQLAEDLCDAGLWLWVEEANAYRIHDWSEYQELTLSEKRAAAGRKGGLRSGQTRSKDGPKSKQTGSKPDLVHEASTDQEPKQVSRPDPSPPVEEPKHSDQTDRTVVHANGGLPAKLISEILDQSDAFRMIRKRRKWPDYEKVLLGWSELDASGMATAADVFASLVAEGYADTPNLLRAACEKVALHGPARELVEAQTREAQQANDWMAGE